MLYSSESEIIDFTIPNIYIYCINLLASSAQTVFWHSSEGILNK